MAAHASPTPTPDSRAETRQDARSRGWRTLAHGAVVAAAVGAYQAVHALVVGNDPLTLGAAVTAAATGAGMAVLAWVHRHWEGAGARVRARRTTNGTGEEDAS